MLLTVSTPCVSLVRTNDSIVLGIVGKQNNYTTHSDQLAMRSEFLGLNELTTNDQSKSVEKG